MSANFFHRDIREYCNWLSRVMPEYTVVCKEQDELSIKIQFRHHKSNSAKWHSVVIAEGYAEKWTTTCVPTELRWTVQNSLLHYVVYLRSENGQL
jgi:hypothetical protein